jgi:glycerol kinase
MASTNDKYECKVRINDFILSSILSDPEASSLVGSIDNGTSSSRFLLITSAGKILSTAQVEYEQCFPSSSPYNEGSCAGWHEHDPFAIWDSVAICIVKTVEELSKHGLDLSTHSNNAIVKAVGITNQRETTLAWNHRTGRIYYNAIVWDDTRTAATADTIMKENKQSNVDPKDVLRSKTGLPVASYFAATKVRWLIDNIPKLQLDLNSPEEREHVRFGTMDTFILYMLTGYRRSVVEMENIERLVHIGGEFKTDVSNASRWLFMNLETMNWDESLVQAVCKESTCWGDNKGNGTIPLSALPKIVPSSDYTIGTIHGIPCSDEGKMALKNVIVGAILGDQQAALFGQTCFVPGMAKCTYGTGLFLMMNTGVKPMSSTQGLLTTVAYQVGKRTGPVESDPSPVIYALEGSVAFSGSTINWLRDRLDLINSAAETEALALSVASNENMYLVPAFSGLFAPHWRPDARGCMVGLTASHAKAHIVRAALESSAYQAREVFEAMTRDSNVELKEMRVDGGATANKFMMQFQADILDTPVVRPEYLETTGWGAGLAAGLAVGVWGSLEEVGQMWKSDMTWHPTMVKEERARCWKGWNKAVERSLGWIDDDN